MGEMDTIAGDVGGQGLTKEERKKQQDKQKWLTRIAPYSKYQSLFEPRNDYETNYQYQTRYMVLGKKYEKLSGVDQKFIHAAKEDGFHWRGDDMEFFRRAYHEFVRYNELSEAEKAEYRKNAIGALEKLS